ncbi:MBL fold metallo-hydrolase [Cytobacillus purgationiresistens]|uniref:Glyoxylase-like metal-dependent hydrolase (Beta-lactamase superfamily II) n=1 Tax=Cytobacillus purgationiresistens TaxID=863449 RepID=A0ABU0ALR7_9BACI|nr:MBL fold metallo-hydrolase [Cytobacillus purgationiresistens]MDQ0271717.1 glyoxylase-like metal-dependent hydrolase (beta-lactamase superfamily II) [Cytobacillus purgationiresistens]
MVRSTCRTIVNIRLSEEDEIETGSRKLKVLHTPGHTLGHVSLYCPEERVLICRDLFHHNDIGWFNILREGTTSIQMSLQSLDNLSNFKIEKAYSGHGPQIDNPLVAIDNARSRVEK